MNFKIKSMHNRQNEGYIMKLQDTAKNIAIFENLLCNFVKNVKKK